MNILSRRLGRQEMSPVLGDFRYASLRTKLMLVLIPSIALILVVAGIITYFITFDYVTIALRRNAMVHNLATAEAVRTLLEEGRKDLSVIAQTSGSPSGLKEYFTRNAAAGGTAYLAAGRIDPDGEGYMVSLLNQSPLQVAEQFSLKDMRPAPHELMLHLSAVPSGHVWISPVETVFIPQPKGIPIRKLAELPAITFATASETPAGRIIHFLILDARDVRNILSLYESEQSPIWAFARTHEVRYSYMFNMAGWILFQSESPDTPEAPLSTYLARSAKTGTLGTPELACAFRPEAKDRFWHIVGDVRQGKKGIMKDPRGASIDDNLKETSIAYAPIMFRPAKDAPSFVYAGVAFSDVSRLTVAAGYKHVDVMIAVVLVACVVAGALIYLICRVLTRSVVQLAEAVGEINQSGSLAPIAMDPSGYEALLLKSSINRMLETIRNQFAEIRRKDRTIRDVGLMQRISSEELSQELHSTACDRMPRIIGGGAVLDALRQEILKAAQVDADVLIVGETGTGKQLTAEAIHLNSRRAEYPFISINCGELDENLLIDTLFGHVKGAFTEARADRQGAFREAENGTLFLDEIQLASPRVQQALLRALAMRLIKPLGSDREVPVNVRVIAATNVDLRKLLAEGRFREDLFFRLNVITVTTPPLRRHPENIVPIAFHYLGEAAEELGKPHLALSRGAVEKLKLYQWPGNIRELKNAIIRAAVMSNNDVIQASCLVLGNEAGHVAGKADENPAAGAERAVSLEEAVCMVTADMEEPLSPDEVAWVPGSVPGDGVAFWAVRSQPGAASGIRDLAADDIPEEQGGLVAGQARSEEVLPSPEVASGDMEGLNSRQRVAWNVLQERGEITRKEYEEHIGGSVAPRTALYDLQDMARRGLVERRGNGPGTVYRLVAAKPSV